MLKRRNSHIARASKHRLDAIVHRSLLALAFAFLPAALQAQSPFDSLHFRSIGPAATGGRIHDIEVDPKDPATIYVARGVGRDLEDHEPRHLLDADLRGACPTTSLAISRSSPATRNHLGGTGEQNNRQSSSWGARRLSLDRRRRHVDARRPRRDTASIGRVVSHPTDPNIAYVAAVGNLWKANPERGVFKTTDGGKSWTKILYVDTLTGATDLAMDPRDPNVLYAATYQRLRSAFGFNGGGPGSAIYKTTDGGATWKKLENGIPAGDKGRIASRDLAVESQCRSSRYRARDGTRHLSNRRRRRDVEQMSRSIRGRCTTAPHSSIPTNDKRIWELGITIVKSEDGGATFEGMPTSPAYDIGLKTDHHTMWIDPRDSRHVIIGGDGG